MEIEGIEMTDLVQKIAKDACRILGYSMVDSIVHEKLREAIRHALADAGGVVAWQYRAGPGDDGWSIAFRNEVLAEVAAKNGQEVRALYTRPVPAVQVPEGWKLVQREASNEAVANTVYNVNRKFDADRVTPELVRLVYCNILHSQPAAPATTPAPVAPREAAFMDAMTYGQGFLLRSADGTETHIPAESVRQPAPVATEAVAQGGGVDAFDAAVEAARNLGATQAKRMAGVYTQTDAVVERGLHEAIAKHRRALLAAAPASPAATGPVPVLLPVVPTAPILGVLNEMLTNCHSVEESYADLRRAAAAPSAEQEKNDE